MGGGAGGGCVPRGLRPLRLLESTCCRPACCAACAPAGRALSGRPAAPLTWRPPPPPYAGAAAPRWASSSPLGATIGGPAGGGAPLMATATAAAYSSTQRHLLRRPAVGFYSCRWVRTARAAVSRAARLCGFFRGRRRRAAPAPPVSAPRFYSSPLVALAAVGDVTGGAAPLIFWQPSPLPYNNTTRSAPSGGLPPFAVGGAACRGGLRGLLVRGRDCGRAVTPPRPGNISAPPVDALRSRHNLDRRRDPGRRRHGGAVALPPAAGLLHRCLLPAHYGCERPHGWPGAISEFLVFFSVNITQID